MAGKQGWFELPGVFAGWALAPWRFAWHERTGTAVLADVHLGAEVSLARQGMYLPDTSSRAILRAWEEVVKVGPRRVVIAGDLFDAAVPDETAVELFERLMGMVPGGCEVVLTRGNHDPDEGFLRARFGGLRLEEKVKAGGVWVTHGHAMAGVRKGAVIVGHQHPAVTVATRVQSAKMICFATCRVGGATGRGGRVEELLVLPAFSPLPLGSNLLTERYWIVDAPRPGPEEVRVYGIVKEQVLEFGTLSGLATV